MCVAPTRRFLEDCSARVLIRRRDLPVLARRPFVCEQCGHRNPLVAPYLRQFVRLRQSWVGLKGEGVEVRRYGLAHQEWHDDDPSVLEPAIMEQFTGTGEWGQWNLQIATLYAIRRGDSTRKAILWEEAFWQARPTIVPGRQAQTFGQVLRRKAVTFSDERSLSELHALPAFIRDIRSYNRLWREMVVAGVTAAPLDDGFVPPGTTPGDRRRSKGGGRSTAAPSGPSATPPETAPVCDTDNGRPS